MLGLTPAPEKNVIKKIPLKSVKRIVEEKLYNRQVKEMISENPFCEIKAPGCTSKATGAHHKQKRSPDNYLKRSNLVRSCASCNLFIEEHPEHKISKKFTISKFKK